MSPGISYVIQAVVGVFLVSALAVLVLFGARRVGFGRNAGPLELVGRLSLDGRRTVYLVRVEGTTYVLGASEAGITKLGELEATGDRDEALQGTSEDGDSS